MAVGLTGRNVSEAASFTTWTEVEDVVVRATRADRRTYLTSTFAPASVSFFLIVSASALLTPSLTVFGAPSTRSLASLRPRFVTSRTALMTPILFAPASVRMTVNSVCSAAGAAAPPPHRRSRGRGHGDRRLDAPLVLELLRQSRQVDARTSWKESRQPVPSSHRPFQSLLRVRSLSCSLKLNKAIASRWLRRLLLPPATFAERAARARPARSAKFC